jgi:alpha-L-fucosidase 2
MNYWPAEVTNLSECHSPLFDLIDTARKQGSVVARKMYDCGGFCIHHNTTAWGDATPTGPQVWHFIWPMGGVWLATHLWEHYLFTRDTDFLRKRAYPILRDCARFIADYAYEQSDGTLITGPGSSPELGFRLPDGYLGGAGLGVTMDMALAREIFTAAIAASEILNTDSDFRTEIATKLKQLAPYRVGRHGQLQEWREDYEEQDPGHRHLSPLLPLFPGHQFTQRKTPEWITASRAFLQRRLDNGSGQTGWSRAWVICLMARLEEGEKAEESVRAMLTGSAFPNLFVDAHGQIQIDGTFGTTAGIAEMLLQSHADEIHLLPALPKAWPTGSVKGLRARGGYTIDISWQDGKLITVTVHSDHGLPCHIRYGAVVAPFAPPAGRGISLNAALQPTS